MIGVYVHIPFCKNICNYCDFCKMLYNPDYVDDYLCSLENEIKERYKGEEITSIYIGGGTPGMLNSMELDRLLNKLSVINLADKYEYTIEYNIEDIDIDKINIMKSYGVNRISFGVQSFSDKIQKILGRNSPEDMIFDNVYLTKKYFDNISIDLIYGVTEDIDIVKNDIEKFLELGINHVSCYSLILEENTKLVIDGHEYIDSDKEREMFEYIRTTLKKNGFKHYEISNYARNGYESIHNKNYWKNLEYYGFGLGAVSFLNHMRISNTKNMRKYLNHEYVYEENYEDEMISKENDLILGLRMIEGIDINDFNQRYNDDLLERDVIKELIRDNYLINENNKLRVREEYIYLLNGILEKIMGSEL